MAGLVAEVYVKYGVVDQINNLFLLAQATGMKIFVRRMPVKQKHIMTPVSCRC